MPGSWEGNRMSGVALATRHRHYWFSTYGLKAKKSEVWYGILGFNVPLDTV